MRVKGRTAEDRELAKFVFGVGLKAVAAMREAREALQAATLDAAELLGRDSDFGSVEAGKVADLVLLDNNPLEDIASTLSIRAVIFGGRLLTREALDQILQQVEARAALH